MLDEQARLVEVDVRHVFQRYGHTWLSFNVTAAVRRNNPRTLLRLLVHIRATTPHSQLDLVLSASPLDGTQFQDQDVQPLLLLSYSALKVFCIFFLYFISLLPKDVFEWLGLLLCIREVPCSNLGPETGNPEVFVIFLGLSKRMRR
jgi:hypothetical protein